MKKRVKLTENDLEGIELDKVTDVTKVEVNPKSKVMEIEFEIEDGKS